LPVFGIGYFFPSAFGLAEQKGSPEVRKEVLDHGQTGQVGDGIRQISMEGGDTMDYTDLGIAVLVIGLFVLGFAMVYAGISNVQYYLRLRKARRLANLRKAANTQVTRGFRYVGPR
jgi:hypothetical protein